MLDLGSACVQLCLQSHDLFVARQEQCLQEFDVVGKFSGGQHGLSLREAADVYKADVGRQVRSGRRQPIPSSSIDNSAWVSETLPLFALWPDEATTLEALCQQTQAVTGPPQDLEHIATLSTEYEHMAAVRVFSQRGYDFHRQAVHPGTHVGDAGGKPDPRDGRQAYHVRRL